MLLREIGVAAKFNPLVEILDEFIVEFDPRHERDQRNRGGAHNDQDFSVVARNESGEPG